MKLRILPPEEMLDVSVELPLSKSMSVRAAVMEAVGACYPGVLSECADVEAMRRVAVVRVGSANAGESGAALRFGVAMLASIPGSDVEITGTERLMSRPMDGLLDVLRTLGADVEKTDCGVHVRGRRLSGGTIAMGVGASSQFVSALLMAAPLMEQGLKITIDWHQPSLPYIDMTLAMMRRRGIDAARDGVEITVRPGTYVAPSAPDVERDWSAAAFWYGIAALTAGFVTLRGMTQESVQGDRAVADIFRRLGVVTSFDAEGAHLCADPEMHARLEYDCSATPDLVPSMAVTAAMLGVPFELGGTEMLRHKECDRVQAIIEELARTGVVVEYDRGVLAWDGRRVPVTEMPVFDPHDDHRMAMALASVAVFAPGIVVDDAECVSKSYPGYWDDLRAAGFEAEEII